MPHRQRVACDAPDVTLQALRIVGEHWNAE
jgi:hypothetical protein